MARRKQFYFYRSALQDSLNIIGEAIDTNNSQMAELAAEMIPPYPFIPYDSIKSGYHLPRVGLIIESAMAQTVRDLDKISAKDWAEFLTEYTIASSGKGITRDQEGLDDFSMSDKMLELSTEIADYVLQKGIRFPYIKMGDTPSHKITSFIAVMWTARHIEALKAKSNESN